MSEKIKDMWKELSMSAGTAIIVLVVLYFVIKWAVKNGMIDAYKEITGKKTHDDSETDKIIRDLDLNDDDTNRKD